MTDTSELVELAERCEAASGPGRELDREIARAQIHWILAGMGEADASGLADAMADIRLDADLDPYTASLDAALTLVPEGWAYRVDWRPDGLDLPRGADPEPALGMVYRGIGQAQLANAATPALALCAAALRARSTQGPNLQDTPASHGEPRG